MTAREMTAPPTAYDRRMRALMNTGVARSLHSTAPRRRATVCAHVVLTVAGAGAWIATVFLQWTWAVVVLAVVLLPWCVATGVINSATRGLLELRGRVLDERQRAERDRVLARAHRVTLLLLLAAALVTGAIGWFGGGRVETALAPVLVALLVTHWLMPHWVAGLTMADEPADE